jgi:hypothetical protein
MQAEFAPLPEHRARGQEGESRNRITHERLIRHPPPVRLGPMGLAVHGGFSGAGLLCDCRARLGETRRFADVNTGRCRSNWHYFRRNHAGTQSRRHYIARSLASGGRWH